MHTSVCVYEDIFLHNHKAIIKQQKKSYLLRLLLKVPEEVNAVLTSSHNHKNYK